MGKDQKVQTTQPYKCYIKEWNYAGRSTDPFIFSLCWIRLFRHIFDYSRNNIPKPTTFSVVNNQPTSFFVDFQTNS